MVTNSTLCCERIISVKISPSTCWLMDWSWQTYPFISASTNSAGDMGDISYRISHGPTVSSPFLVNNWFGIYKRLLLRHDDNRLELVAYAKGWIPLLLNDCTELCSTTLPLTEISTIRCPDKSWFMNLGSEIMRMGKKLPLEWIHIWICEYTYTYVWIQKSKTTLCNNILPVCSGPSG